MDNEEILKNEGIQETAIPTIPTNVELVNSTPSTITLKWDNSTEATGYRIYRNTTQDGEYLQVGEVSGTTYTDTNLNSNTTYYYYVSAYNELGESERSDIITIATSIIEPPTDLVLTPINNTSIRLTWTPPTNYDSFIIYRSESEDGTFNQIATVTTTNYVDDGLTNNTTYYYRVGTVINNEISTTFATGNATTLNENTTQTLEYPTRVVAIRVNCSTLELRWNLVNNATGYRIYRATSVDGTYELIATAYGFNYFDNDLNANTTYYYYIVSFNAEQESERSTIFMNTTSQSCNTSCYDSVCRIVNNNGIIYKCCCYRRKRCVCCNYD